MAYWTPEQLTKLQPTEGRFDQIHYPSGYTSSGVKSSASGGYGFLDSTWRQFAGPEISAQYPRAYMAPPEVQTAVALRTPQSHWTGTDAQGRPFNAAAQRIAGGGSAGQGKSGFPGGEGYNPETGTTQLTVSPQEMPPPLFLDKLLDKAGGGQTQGEGEGLGPEAFLDTLLQPPPTAQAQPESQVSREMTAFRQDSAPQNIIGAATAAPPLAQFAQAAEPQSPQELPQATTIPAPAPAAEPQPAPAGPAGFLDSLLTQFSPVGSAQAAEREPPPQRQAPIAAPLPGPLDHRSAAVNAAIAEGPPAASEGSRLLDQLLTQAATVPGRETDVQQFQRQERQAQQPRQPWISTQGAELTGRIPQMAEAVMPYILGAAPAGSSSVGMRLPGRRGAPPPERIEPTFGARPAAPPTGGGATPPTPRGPTPSGPAAPAAATRSVSQRAGQAIANAFSTPAWRAARAKGATDKEAARANIREQVGLARQAKAQASAALEDVRAAVAPHIPAFRDYIEQVHAGGNPPKPPLMQMLDHIEGRGSLASGDPLLAVADKLKQQYEKVRRDIELSIPDQKAFIDDYYRHIWEETTQAPAPGFGAGKQGSGASLKQRKIPTIGEGIEQGLTPAILDPVENTLHYVAGMHDYLAFHRAREVGKSAGYIRTTPERGDVKLLGSGAPHYAPPGYAKMWNNYYGRGFRQWSAVGGVYDKLLQAVNTVTAAKLGLSGFHAFTIAQETAVAGLAHALGRLKEGQLGAAMKEAGYSVSVLPKLREQYLRGKRLQEAYLDIGTGGNNFDRELANLYAAGGGRAVSRGMEYSASGLSNYWEAFKRGALKMELATGLRNIGAKGGPIAYAPVRAAGMFAREMSRLMQTVSAPLFDSVIPKIKFAAWADEMEAWMNKNPGATREEQLAQSRHLMDSMDDRFGEMVQDNLFWNPILKQTLNLLATSVGWEYGSLRAFATGGKDLARSGGKLLTGDIKGAGEALSTRARWLLAFPAIMAAGAAVYQYLIKRQPVSDTPWQDLNVPRTGGTTPEGAPERALLPGYQKDVLQWWHELSKAKNPIEAGQAVAAIGAHKLNPAGQLAKGFLTGKDALGRDIVSKVKDPETGQLPSWWSAYSKFVLDGFTPIPFQQPRLKGNAIREPERFVGIRPAPEWLQNPERVEAIERKIEKSQMKKERFRTRKQQNREIRPGVP